jgi:hypothetical protein
LWAYNPQEIQATGFKPIASAGWYRLKDGSGVIYRIVLKSYAKLQKIPDMLKTASVKLVFFNI